MNNNQTFNGSEIAVIGMAGQFPGAKNIDEYWSNLKSGKDTISHFSLEELEGFDFLSKSSSYVKAKGYLEDTEYFDPFFFGYSPNEAKIMEPQIRVFLQTSWKALEDSGYVPKQFDGLIGVYAAARSNPIWYHYIISQKGINFISKSLDILLEKDYLCTHVSYRLDLRGPSYSINSACSSSLVAIDLACQGLLLGQCDMALAGGVRVTIPQKLGYFYQEGMIYSPDGRCRAFDAQARGTVFGDGVGVVVLKRLKDAMQDKDNIYAIIKSSAINNDGSRKAGYTAPSIQGQAEVIKAAQLLAEVEPETISYIEAHGTGTIIGDNIEIEALQKAFNTKKKRFCKIGSVKTNIGHLETAAGIASLIKTVLILRHKEIPPSLYFETANPQIDFDNSPFQVNTKLSKYYGQQPFRAGVSSFGIGGTNVHVILEEAPKRVETTEKSRDIKMIMLSAKTKNSLDMAIKNFEYYLRENLGVDLADVAYTLQVGRRRFEHCAALVCSNISEAIEKLAEKKLHCNFVKGYKGNIVFVFPGQGSQYVNMGLELYQTEIDLRNEMEYCFGVLSSLIDFDLKDILYPNINNSESSCLKINETYIAQIALFVIQFALAKLLIKWGIRPSALIGHSIGEYVAACISGVLSVEDALKIVAIRGYLMQKAPRGAMLSIPLSQKEVGSYLTEDISLAVINSPTSCVLSGSDSAINDLELKLKKHGYNSKRLQTSHAFHSAMMEPVLEAFKEELKKIKFTKPHIPYISNLTGNWISDEEATSPQYYVKHLRSTVKFADGLSRLSNEADNIFIELGPGQLSTFIKQYPANTSELKVVNLLRHPNGKQSDVVFLFNKLVDLWLSGIEINWNQFYKNETRYRVSLPTYEFDRHYFPISFVNESPDPINTDLNPKRANCNIKDVESAAALLNEGFVSNNPPKTVNEMIVAKVWREVLGIDEIDIDDDYFELGGDSLKAIEILSKLNERNISIPLKKVIEYPTIKSLAAFIDENTNEVMHGEKLYPLHQADHENLYTPFPLTEVQMSYLIGRAQNYDIGNISTHLYTEYQMLIDSKRFNVALNKVIKHHPMLRAVILKNGTQKIIPEIQWYTIKETDISNLNESAQRQIVAELRSRMSHHIFETDQWPLFDIKLLKLDKQLYHLFFGFDLLIGDVASLEIFKNELVAFYHDPGLVLPAIEFTFRDYIIAFHKLKKSSVYLRDKEYWLSKIADFPMAPQLALKCNPGDLKKPRFSRKKKVFKNEQWLALLNITKKSNITPSALLCTVYAELLSHWSNQSELAINLTVFNRYPFHSDVNRIIGDFTGVVLLAFDFSKSEDFIEKVKQTQNSIYEALERRHYDGTEFIRELSKFNNVYNQALMPYVFTSTVEGAMNNLNTIRVFAGGNDNFGDLGKEVFTQTQTSQVFIDNQISITSGGELMVVWDYVEELFEPEVIDAMFEQYENLINEICNAYSD
jgi:acyl transferase domain-containing protein/acyl carrier protein